MKLTIIVCLAMFAVACYAVEDTKKAETISLLKRLLEKKSDSKTTTTHNAKKEMLSKFREMRTKKALKRMGKSLDVNCAVDVEPFEGEDAPDGAWIYYPKSSRKRDHDCTIHIKADKGKAIYYFLEMGHPGDHADDCANGGELTLYDGSDTSGRKLEHGCDTHEAVDDFSPSNELFISYEPDHDFEDDWWMFAYAYVDEESRPHGEEHTAVHDEDEHHSEEHHDEKEKKKRHHKKDHDASYHLNELFEEHHDSDHSSHQGNHQEIHSEPDHIENSNHEDSHHDDSHHDDSHHDDDTHHDEDHSSHKHHKKDRHRKRH